MREQLRASFKNGFYVVLVFLFLLTTKALFRLRIEGRENLRRAGRYIAVARHKSYWDIPIVAVALGFWNRIHFISRKGLMRKIIGVRSIIRAYSTIIDRENFGRADFRRMLESIKRERLIGIFPEGTTQRQIDAKAGAVHFASLTRKELLPVNIRAEGPYPPKYPFGFPRVTVSIGVPFSVTALEEEPATEISRSEQYRRMSERLMLRVDNA